MTEKQLYESLKRVWTPTKKSGHAVRIESYVGPGVPDVNWVIDGVEFWTELKIASPAGKFQEPLKREQAVWLYDRTRAGGMAWVVARESEPAKGGDCCLYYAWKGGVSRNLLINDHYVFAVEHIVTRTAQALLAQMQHIHRASKV